MTHSRKTKQKKPNPDQTKALEILSSRENIFLTGAAGTGKSFVVSQYLKSLKEPVPILASTGAAAVLVGGRTFHSFFGLGILEGGITKTVERAVKFYKVRSRIKDTHEVVIDEVSMIHPQAFAAADLIARKIRGNTTPFGGIRMILTGDFFQLPPVDRFNKEVSLLFQTDEWQNLAPKCIELREPMRSKDIDFLAILSKIRHGICDQEVQAFLHARKKPLDPSFLGTVLFPRKDNVDAYNDERLQSLKEEMQSFPTEVNISSKSKMTKEQAMASAPLPETLFLKVGALVMLRKNDPDGMFVNGSLGLIHKISKDSLTVELLAGGEVTIERDDFQILDADGEVMATITNFPVTLGWAATIHKAQGASIDRLHVDLGRLWESGQAYVALSRAKDPSQLFIGNWSPGSFKADHRVREFYEKISAMP